MNGINGLKQYGLDAMGILDITAANKVLIDCMISTFGNILEQACVVSHACLEELYSKCERIHDGHSTGSMMFTIILGNDAELTAKRNALSKMMIEQLIPLTHYKIHLDGNVLRANKEIV